MEETNFLYTPDSHSSKTFQAWLHTTLFTGGIVVVIGMLLIVYTYTSYKKEHEEAELVARDVATLQKIINNLQSIDTDYKAMQHKRALFEEWDEPCLLQQCLPVIATLIPESVRLIKITPVDSKTVSMQGESIQPTSVVELVEKMREDSWAAEVSLEELQQQPIEDMPAGVSFRLKLVKA